MIKNNCRKCGTCCLFVEMQMKNTAFDKQWIEFLKITRPNNFILTNNDKTLKIISPCIHLNIETKECNIYEDRPTVCREYQCKRCE